MIETLETVHPELHGRYVAKQNDAERTLAYVRSKPAGFPLTGRGDVNTYMLFAELARTLVAPHGRVGLLVPSGIATDNTTKDFFGDLMTSQTLIRLYDFENKRPWFDDVHRSFKFTVLIVSGRETQHPEVDFAFFLNEMEDLASRDRHIPLSIKELKLLNPNTKTCPIFRSRRDADLTKAIYKRVPILIDDNRRQGGNSWGVKFCTMFHQTNDAEHFVDGPTLKADDFRLSGNRWTKADTTFLPLYKAKMIQGYDHRAAGVRIEAGNWMRQGQTEDTTLVEHQNPEFVVQPRYWVSAEDVASVFSEAQPAFIGFKDISSATNRRTMIAAAVPWSALTNHVVVIRSTQNQRRQLCLLANLNALAYDYVSRQKVGAITLNFFIVEQLPTLPPDTYDDPCPWDKATTLEAYVAERVLKLTCTAEDMIPLAEAAGFAGENGTRVHKWREPERARLRAELDAAYFRLYGLTWDEIDYVLTTFQGIKGEDDAAPDGVGETRRLIRTAWDATAAND